MFNSIRSRIWQKIRTRKKDEPVVEPNPIRHNSFIVCGTPFIEAVMYARKHGKRAPWIDWDAVNENESSRRYWAGYEDAVKQTGNEFWGDRDEAVAGHDKEDLKESG